MALLVGLLDAQAALFRLCQGLVDHDDVVYAPHTPVSYGAVAVVQHLPERVEEAVLSHLGNVLASAQPLGHALVERVIVHVAHHHDLDSGISGHHLLRILAYDLGTEAPEVASLASDSGRKVGHIDGKILSVNASVYHEDIPGAEFLLLLRAEGNRDFGALEGERNGPAVNEGELVRPVEKPHVHAAAVRSVMVNNLEMGVLKLRLGHEVLENETVLNLGNTEDGVEGSVGFCHFRNDGGHVVELLLIFDVSPLVGSVRKELVVVLSLFVIGVEEILQIVEPDDVILPGLERIATGQCGRQCEKQRNCGNQRNDCDM